MSKQEARTDKAHGASPAPLGKGAKPVRISFDMTEDEATRLCALRYEPKPSTAAAQVVRMVLGGGAAAQGARLAPRARDKARARDGEGAAE